MTVRDLAHFESWLTDRGAEVLDASSEREIIRVRSSTGTHVVYADKTGKQRWPKELLAIVSEYNAGRTPSLAATKRGGAARRKTRGRYVALTKRDGPGCFYCARILPAPGAHSSPDDEVTTEHLVSRAHGGPDHMSNCFLSHFACNQIAGHMSAPEKIKLREMMRGAK
ncbi:HNH endonuclease [Mesorhizobium sp. M6A.T.Cr.TU.016.01.1.1]|uniref:HNH endonuclease n=1 Tax=Mesorhizobium sp. M6A.T.Cr.TU.016.01.1.1 TaxID=2493677 RepID=UPI000F761D77|nr:HNH endonuclease [Mesorhizobium sp. M6A.T.Cr.TU.016.01.1.1]AZO67647.1 HNH endonuclease [Mesorhizobium sp. M6A.T.Cr.TU.016.01.1.1]